MADLSLKPGRSQQKRKLDNRARGAIGGVLVLAVISGKSTIQIGCCKFYMGEDKSGSKNPSRNFTIRNFPGIPSGFLSETSLEILLGMSPRVTEFLTRLLP